MPKTLLSGIPEGIDRQASEMNTTLVRPLSREAITEASTEIASPGLFGAPESSHTSEPPFWKPWPAK